MANSVYECFIEIVYCNLIMLDTILFHELD